MKKRFGLAFFLSLLVLLSFGPVLGGDSFFGKVTEVRAPNVVVIDNGKARFVVNIVGIEPAREAAIASQAKQLVADLVLNKDARVRILGWTQKNEMVAQLLTANKEIGIKDVAVEMVRAGMARRQQGKDEDFGYKYGELNTAERQARAAKRGLWKTQ
ncbi:MAG TPA: thermonuclease family protein [Pyrinomonadaceae bacterium]|jgi:endonuclease YncB( thermonuclease family)|nr:thermonuclease family protein [Pyrinomonadaceae bacterium]